MTRTSDGFAESLQRVGLRDVQTLALEIKGMGAQGRRVLNTVCPWLRSPVGLCTRTAYRLAISGLIVVPV